MPSFEALGSSLNPGSATTHWWRSVKRTPSGSTSGWTSISASAISSASFQVMMASSFWYLHHHVAADDRLAAETGVQRQPFRRVEAILLILLHRREVLFPLTHDDVTGRAGAAPSAVVLEVHVVRERDVQERARPSVVGQRVLRVVDLDGDIAGEKGDLVRSHHFSSRISSARREVTAPLSAASIIASASRSVTLFRSMVRSRMASRSVPHSTARSASMAWLIACSSSRPTRWPPCLSARRTWFITVSASVLVSIRSRALTSSSA